MYPSGIAGGKVVAENPEFSVHVIEDRSVMARGPAENSVFTMPGAPGRIISVSAFRRGAEPLDLTAKDRRFTWSVPEGEWRIVWVVERVLRPKPGWVMDNMIDVMNPHQLTAAFSPPARPISQPLVRAGPHAPLRARRRPPPGQIRETVETHQRPVGYCRSKHAVKALELR
jgi:hypothetical protein